MRKGTTRYSQDSTMLGNYIGYGISSTCFIASLIKLYAGTPTINGTEYCVMGASAIGIIATYFFTEQSKQSKVLNDELIIIKKCIEDSQTNTATLSKNHNDYSEHSQKISGEILAMKQAIEAFKNDTQTLLVEHHTNSSMKNNDIINKINAIEQFIAGFETKLKKLLDENNTINAIASIKNKILAFETNLKETLNKNETIEKLDSIQQTIADFKTNIQTLLAKYNTENLQQRLEKIIKDYQTNTETLLAHYETNTSKHNKNINDKIVTLQESVTDCQNNVQKSLEKIDFETSLQSAIAGLETAMQILLDTHSTDNLKQNDIITEKITSMDESIADLILNIQAIKKLFKKNSADNQSKNFTTGKVPSEVKKIEDNITQSKVEQRRKSLEGPFPFKSSSNQ